VRYRTPGGSSTSDTAAMDLLFGVIVFLYIVVIAVSLHARRDAGISRHPYRNPYGDAPGAWSD
jgi:hypothetical protein